MPRVSDTRVVAYEPLLPPALLDELPLDGVGVTAALVEQGRKEACAVLNGVV
jgi:hypothetical protein